MSIQSKLELSTSSEDSFRHTPKGTLRMIQGGLSQEEQSLGKMPIPVAESPYVPGDALKFDCPAPKFERGGSHLLHDLSIPQI